jgi:hypothetical protein
MQTVSHAVHNFANTIYVWQAYSGLTCKQEHFLISGFHREVDDWLRAGRSGDQIPVWVRFFVHVQTGPGANPASCTMGTGLSRG